MIIFVEGPDNACKNDMYSKFLESSHKVSNESNVYMYDIAGEHEDVRHALYCAHSKMVMIMDMCDKYKNLCMVINGGPLSQVIRALEIDDVRLASEMSSVFSMRQYHDVHIISVFSSDTDKEMQKSYRDVSSRHMGVISDHSKRNSYTMFNNKRTENTYKLFNSDVLALINK